MKFLMKPALPVIRWKTRVAQVTLRFAAIQAAMEKIGNM